ncbi:hypothetical protein KDA_43620 [Dictyobacter alpinus]|uniref:Uncharacterized protein n=1 Tax=Dictyobacter alpinus TaxID=2014873 RepID=A0A402BBT1_9CHLR|nr:hypothetical protein KDA_43620 [Dictyobacter alpinus]
MPLKLEYKDHRCAFFPKRFDWHLNTQSMVKLAVVDRGIFMLYCKHDTKYAFDLFERLFVLAVSEHVACPTSGLGGSILDDQHQDRNER